MTSIGIRDLPSKSRTRTSDLHLRTELGGVIVYEEEQKPVPNDAVQQKRTLVLGLPNS